MPPIHPFPYFAGFEPANPYLPSFYAQADDLEQRIMHLCREYCKLVQFTDSMVDTLNDSYAVIEDMREKLPGLIDDATAKEIARLVESGQFAEMIKEELKDLSQELFGITADFTFNCLATFDNAEPANSMQGGCILSDTRCAMLQRDDSNYANNTINIYDMNNGVVVASSSASQVSHCNSLTYKPDAQELYANGATEAYDGTQTRYVVYNAETLEYVREGHITAISDVDSEFVLGALIYNRQTGYFVAIPICGYGWPNQTMYLLSADLSEIINTYTINGTIGRSVNGTGQAGAFILMQSSEPSYIYLFRIDESEKTLQLFSVRPFIRKFDGVRYISEMEWIDGTDERHVYGGWMNINASGGGGFSQSIGVTSIYEHERAGSRQGSLYADNLRLLLYVDPSQALPDRDGSADKPFRTFSEAANCLLNRPSYTRVNCLNKSGDADTYQAASVNFYYAIGNIRVDLPTSSKINNVNLNSCSGQVDIRNTGQINGLLHATSCGRVQLHGDGCDIRGEQSQLMVNSGTYRLLNDSYLDIQGGRNMSAMIANLISATDDDTMPKTGVSKLSNIRSNEISPTNGVIYLADGISYENAFLKITVGSLIFVMPILKTSITYQALGCVWYEGAYRILTGRVGGITVSPNGNQQRTVSVTAVKISDGTVTENIYPAKAQLIFI